MCSNKFNAIILAMKNEANNKAKQIEDMKKKRARLFEEILAHEDLMDGTFIERYSTCSRDGCKCHDGDKHGPRYYFAVTRDGRQKQHYVRKGNKDLVLAGIDSYHQVQELLYEITEINRELIDLEDASELS